MIGNSIYGILVQILMSYCKVIGKYWVLALGRHMQGIYIGGASSCSLLYINEIAPKQYKGTYGTCFQLGVTFGILFSNIIGLPFILGNWDTWPHLLLVGITFPILQLCLCVFVPETPTYLFSKGHSVKAIQANIILKGPNAVIAKEEKVKGGLFKNVKALFKDKLLRRTLIICCSMMLFQQFSGINAVFFYSTSIFSAAGMSTEIADLATVGLSFLNMISVFLAMAATDKFGRKILLLVGFSVMSLSAIGATVLLTLGGNDPEKASFYTTLGIVPIAIYVIAFELGPGPVPWILSGEMVPTQYKASATALATALDFWAAGIIGLIVPPLQKAMGGYIFVIFVIINFLAVGYVFGRVVETKGKGYREVLDEIGLQNDWLPGISKIVKETKKFRIGIFEFGSEK